MASSSITQGKAKVKKVQVKLPKSTFWERSERLKRFAAQYDKPVSKAASSAPAASSSSSSGPSQSAPGSQATSQPGSAPQPQPEPRKRPVPVNEDDSSSSEEPDAKRVKFHGICLDQKEDDFDRYAWDIVMRWDWPEPSKLDREAKDRVHKEIELIEKAKVLEKTLAAAMRKRDKFKAEYRQAEKMRSDLRTKVSLLPRLPTIHMGCDQRLIKILSQVNLEKKISREEGVIEITAEAMKKLTIRYNESHQQKWEGAKQQNLWEREKLTAKQRERKIAKWLDKKSDKEKEERKSKVYTPSGPLAKQKGWVKDAASKPQGIAKRTRGATKPRAPTPPPRPAMPTPAPPARARKRKSLPNDQVNFDEDSEGECENPEAYQVLMDRSYELIKEGKRSEKGTQRTGNLFSAEERGERKRQEKAKAEAEQLERQRKNKKLARKLFPSEQSSEDTTETMDTPVDSGYETGSIAL